jgi:hypothetical protein
MYFAFLIGSLSYNNITPNRKYKKGRQLWQPSLSVSQAQCLPPLSFSSTMPALSLSSTVPDPHPKQIKGSKIIDKNQNSSFIDLFRKFFGDTTVRADLRECRCQFLL